MDVSFDQFLEAVIQQESGGDPNAKNKGSGAIGLTQIMQQNLDGSWGGRPAREKFGWDFDALGYDVTPEQLQKSPELQLAITRYILKPLFDKHGAEGAARIWFAGPQANAKLDKNSPYDSQTARRYGQEVVARIKKPSGGPAKRATPKPAKDIGGSESLFAGSPIEKTKTPTMNPIEMEIQDLIRAPGVMANSEGQVPVLNGREGLLVPSTPEEADLFTGVVNAGVSDNVEPHYAAAAQAIAEAQRMVSSQSIMGDTALSAPISQMLDQI